MIPKNHGFGTRRVPLEDQVLRGLQQPNVKLVDIKETPIERITPTGIKTSDASTISTSSSTPRASTPSHRRLRPHRLPGRRRPEAEGQVEGRAADLSRHHGQGFPNMMMQIGPHTALGNIPAASNTASNGSPTCSACSEARCHAHRGDARRGPVVTDHVKSPGCRAAVQRDRFVDDRHQPQTSRARRRASSPATAAAPRLPRTLRRRGGGRLPRAAAGVTPAGAARRQGSIKCPGAARRARHRKRSWKFSGPTAASNPSSCIRALAWSRTRAKATVTPWACSSLTTFSSSSSAVVSTRFTTRHRGGHASLRMARGQRGLQFASDVTDAGEEQITPRPPVQQAGKGDRLRVQFDVAVGLRPGSWPSTAPCGWVVVR